MPKTKEPKNHIPMKEFGMSEYFRNISGGEPFFIFESGQLMQNIKCRITGPDFIKHYNKFLGKK